MSPFRIERRRLGRGASSDGRRSWTANFFFLLIFEISAHRLGRSGQRAAVTQTLEAINTLTCRPEPAVTELNDHTLATETTLLLALEGKGTDAKSGGDLRRRSGRPRMTYLLIIVLYRFAFFFGIVCIVPSQSSSPFVFSRFFSCSKLLHDFSFFLSVVGRPHWCVNIVKKSSYAARPETDRRHGWSWKGLWLLTLDDSMMMMNTLLGLRVVWLVCKFLLAVFYFILFYFIFSFDFVLFLLAVFCSSESLSTVPTPLSKLQLDLRELCCKQPFLFCREESERGVYHAFCFLEHFRRFKGTPAMC